jgi:hypothetical protein
LGNIWVDFKQPPFCVWCGGSHLHKEWSEKTIQHRYRHAATSGWKGNSSLQLPRLQARQGKDAKEEVADSAQDYNGKDVLFQPHHLTTILRGIATQQHTAAAASDAFSCTDVVSQPVC